MTGAGRPTDASFSMFVSLHAFTFPPSLFHLSPLLPLSFLSIRPIAVMLGPAGSVQPSHTLALCHMLLLTSTAALGQGVLFYTRRPHQELNDSVGTNNSTSAICGAVKTRDKLRDTAVQGLKGQSGFEVLSTRMM